MPPEPVVLTVTLDPAQLELVASRVAEMLRDGRDDGFLNVDGAAEFLGRSKKSIYHLVERRKLPHHRAGGRLLFDPKQLRVWAERHGMNDPTPALANPRAHEHVVRTSQMPRRRANAPGPDTEDKLHVNQEG